MLVISESLDWIKSVFAKNAKEIQNDKGPKLIWSVQTQAVYSHVRACLFSPFCPSSLRSYEENSTSSVWQATLFLWWCFGDKFYEQEWMSKRMPCKLSSWAMWNLDYKLLLAPRHDTGREVGLRRSRRQNISAALRLCWFRSPRALMQCVFANIGKSPSVGSKVACIEYTSKHRQ